MRDINAGATDVEFLVHGEPAGQRTDLRLWLRLLSCSNLVTQEIRRRLRIEFDTTLPRFDLMAQIAREPNGLRLGELSKRMMVSNGNVTAPTDRLVAEGLVVREIDSVDRRASIARLTPKGAELFSKMAAAHETWLKDLFCDVDAQTEAQLMALLSHMKQSIKSHSATSESA
jgi:DNA-binding MarR family transcriptional regulator